MFHVYKKPTYDDLGNELWEIYESENSDDLVCWCFSKEVAEKIAASMNKDIDSWTEPQTFVDSNKNWVAIPSIDCEEEQRFYIVEKDFWNENGCCQDDSELPDEIPDFGFREGWEQVMIEGIEYEYYGYGDPLVELEKLRLEVRNWNDHPDNQ